MVTMSQIKLSKISKLRNIFKANRKTKIISYPKEMTWSHNNKIKREKCNFPATKNTGSHKFLLFN